MDFGTDLASKSQKTHPIHILYEQRKKGTFYISALGINWLMHIIYPTATCSLVKKNWTLHVYHNF